MSFSENRKGNTIPILQTQGIELCQQSKWHKGTRSVPRTSSNERSPTDTLILAQWDPCQKSDLQNCKVINVCCLNHFVCRNVLFSNNRKLILMPRWDSVSRTFGQLTFWSNYYAIRGEKHSCSCFGTGRLFCNSWPYPTPYSITYSINIYGMPTRYQTRSFLHIRLLLDHVYTSGLSLQLHSQQVVNEYSLGIYKY